MSSKSTMKPLEPDQVPVVPNFDMKRFMGGWYVYSRTDNWAEKGLKCGKDTYTELAADGKSFKVTYSAERDYPFLWKPFSANMQGQILDLAQPARQRHGPSFMQSGPPNYFIVDTDYDNYAAVYSPISLAFGCIKVYHAWILVRDRNGPANRELLQNAYAAVERCGISRDALMKIKQDCTSN